MGTTMEDTTEPHDPLAELEGRIAEYLDEAATQQELAEKMRDVLGIVSDKGRERADEIVGKG
jgi:hypothetical protein